MVQITNLKPEVFEGINVAVDWIQDLKSSNSRKHKEKVIERALIASRLGSSSAQCFLYNCYLAYNPFFVYNMKHVPKTENLTERENPWIEFWGLLEELRTTPENYNKNAVEKMKIISERFDSNEWNFLARPVILKNLKSGISAITLNRVLSDTEWEIPVFGCQYPVKIHDVRQLSGNKSIEPKLDGTRMLALVSNSSVILYNKNGSPFQNFHNIKESLSDCSHICRHIVGGTLTSFIGAGFVLDGILVTNPDVHSKLNVNSTDIVPVEDSVLYIFDIIPLTDFRNGEWGVEYNKRKRALDEISKTFRRTTSNIRVIDGIKLDLASSEGHNILTRYSKMLHDSGFDTIVIKDLKSPYLRGKNNSWVLSTSKN